MTVTKFKMKNYTTEVTPERSIAEIEKMLALFGATAIMKEFTPDGRVFDLAFKIQDKAFKLPAHVDGVKKVLFEGSRPPTSKDIERRREDRANRVAWRIIKDWIHAQLSLIASGQAHPHEVFLPYMFDGKKTLYQTYTDGLLLGPKVKNE